MVAGHLQEKNGLYYAVLGYTDAKGKRHQPWIPTGLAVKGNKRKAEFFLLETRKNFEVPVPDPEEASKELSPNMLFADYMMVWLDIAKSSIELTTYSSYFATVTKKIVPYFQKLGVTLGGLEARHIQTFYLEQLRKLAPNSVIKMHANLHRALKYAVKMDLIPSNPVEKVDRPKVNKYIASYYNGEELEKLFEVSKDHRLSLLIQMTAFYGLRRSEIVGLKWDAFDFNNNTLTIRHIVTSVNLEGNRTIVKADRAKTKSSLRTLPLLNGFKERLQAQQEQQKYNQKICGNCYNQEFLGYVFVDELGCLLAPDYVSRAFKSILRKHNLPDIRFHDLRHSCASLLLANDVPMKQIQEWLGHSDISTTSNIYAHLDYSSKLSSAEALTAGLTLPKITAAVNPWK